MTSVLIQHIPKKLVQAPGRSFGHGESGDDASLSRLPTEIGQLDPSNPAGTAFTDLPGAAGDEFTRHRHGLGQGRVGRSIKRAFHVTPSPAPEAA